MSGKSRKSSSSPHHKTRRIGPSPSPDINAGIITFLEHKLSRTFPELTFFVNTNSGEKTEIRGYSCENNEKCECFNLVITHAEHQRSPLLSSGINHILLDRVRYKYGDECSLTGTDIMTRLARVFTAMEKKGFPHKRPTNQGGMVFDKVQLYDRARVKIGGKEVLLSMHYIIQHGIPWYAKFGFRTPQYDSEVAANELTMNKPITPMLLKRLNSKLSPELQMSKGTTFRQAAKMLFTGGHMDAYLELYDYLTDTKAKRLKYAYYDMWFIPH